MFRLLGWVERVAAFQNFALAKSVVFRVQHHSWIVPKLPEGLGIRQVSEEEKKHQESRKNCDERIVLEYVGLITHGIILSILNC